MFKSPCKDCNDRSVGFHSFCEQYITAKAAYIEDKDRVRQLKEADRICNAAKMDAVIKTKRMFRKRGEK